MKPRKCTHPTFIEGIMEIWRAWRNPEWRERTIAEAQTIHHDPIQGKAAMTELAGWVHTLYIRQCRMTYENLYHVSGKRLTLVEKKCIALNRSSLPLVDEVETFNCLAQISKAFGFEEFFEGHFEEFVGVNMLKPTEKKARFSGVVRAFRSCYRHRLEQEANAFVRGVVPLSIKIQIIRRLLASHAHAIMANRCLEHADIDRADMEELLFVGYPDPRLTRFWVKLRCLINDQAFYAQILKSL